MCRAIEMMLNKKGIPYESCTDVDEMIKLGITGTPALSVDGKLYVKGECRDWINQQ
jgi:hypothetical protein